MLGEESLDRIVQIARDRFDNMRCLNEDRNVVDEVDQHRHAKDGQQDGDADGHVRHDTRVSLFFHDSQDKKTLQPRRQKSSPGELCRQIVDKRPQ